MNRMVALAKGKREAEHRLAHAQALALARAGRLGAARAQSNRAWLSPFKKGMTKSQRTRIFRMMMRKIIQFKLAEYCGVIGRIPALGKRGVLEVRGIDLEYTPNLVSWVRSPRIWFPTDAPLVQFLA